MAVLVVDASPGEFESGFLSQGQTKEHALLARCLGIKHVIVAVNKLDYVQWNKDRFKEIERLLLGFLTNSCGFKKQSIDFIPVSGLLGVNLIHITACDWYKGPSLIEAIGSRPSHI